MSKALLLPLMLLRQPSPRPWEERQALLLSSDWRMTMEAVEALTGADLGSSDRDEIASRLAALLVHLLKWEFQPDGRTERWRTDIRMHRLRIAMAIIRRPSLARYPGRILREQYRLARRLAAIDTGLGRTSFPEDCPYSPMQTLDSDYLPAAA